ncbi:MAG: Asp-tRNA(Asn)/Glu-tRNA(Gln) amidotransferase subunit GatB [Eubacteriales bacterium]|jgi:aspartyl-tRNA(Asn)/glutamyl-tRNA(Gln) amidotransferase subunit B
MWEMTGGLETHVELSTRSKIFCGCSTRFGEEPNTNCCPVCMGHPGTLPQLNREVVRYAILAGLATHCTIRTDARMDRKNYLYPDLPKAYQISQYEKPLCENGWLTLQNGRRIGIQRIHIEEDAGKLIHGQGRTLVDYNRAGVPLIEIVTQPDFHTPEEIREYLESLQRLMRYLGISDCKMQEGSLRCDVNISARRAGDTRPGTRTELKNMNSFTNIEKAVRYEFARQCRLLEEGQPVVQETRRWEEQSGRTYPMRSKEDAQDYRYFREPDLPAIRVEPQEVEALRQMLPELPEQKWKRYTEQLGLTAEDALQLVKYRRVAEFFEAAVEGRRNPREGAHFIVGQMFRTFPTEEDKERFEVKITPAQLGQLLELMEQGRLRNNLAKGALEQMLATGRPVTDFVSREDMAQLREAELLALCQKAMEALPQAAADYRAGKEKAVKALVGGVMKASRGRADAVRAEQQLRQLLDGRGE